MSVPIPPQAGRLVNRLAVGQVREGLRSGEGFPSESSRCAVAAVLAEWARRS